MDLPLLPQFEFPRHRMGRKEYIYWRNLLYRRCEEAPIRTFFMDQAVTCDHKEDWFWCHIYGSIRTLTWKLHTQREMYDRSFKFQPDDAPDPVEDVMSWWSVSCRAQFYFDRHGIVMLPHKGQFKRNGLIYTIDRRYFDA